MEKRRMKNMKLATAEKNRRTRRNIPFIATALVLMLAIPMLIVSLPSANAVSISEIDTYPYMIVTPNPVGVDQVVIVTFGIDKTSPIALIRSGNYEGLTVKITKPDGTTENKGPYTAYSMGNVFLYYTPKQVGNYTFEGTFPGQWINGSYRTISERGTWSNSSSNPLTEAAWYYKPSTEKATLVVQENPIPSYPETPLPTGFWTRPLNAEIKGWPQTADNWLMAKYDEPAAWRFSATAFAPYTSAPNSAHVLWKQQVSFGGAVGGPYGDISYRTGLSYEPFYSYSIVLNGRILYDDHGPTSTSVYGTRCIDLYTGEEIYYLTNVTIAFAQVLAIDNPNEHGAMSYLWEVTGSATNGTWRMYDAFSGRQILTVTNITGSSGNTRFGPKGELLAFTVSGSGANRRYIMWNSTRAILFGDPATRNAVLQGTQDDYWSPGYLSTVDGSKGIEWNVSIPATPNTNRVIAINVKEGYLLTAYTDHEKFPFIFGQEAYPTALTKTAGNYPSSIQPAWVQNRTSYTMREAFTNINNGVYALWDEGLRVFYGYNIKTGEQLWTTEPVPIGWGIFTAGTWIAYGKLYTAFYDGWVRAYDVADGKLAWDFYMGDIAYMENAYATLPAYGFTIADNKVFVSNDEHSPDSVLWRGGKLWALNAETGDLEWSISGRLRHATVSDGILTAFNLYDNQIYTFGKGPSKTTVTAPDTSVPLGTSVMIRGTVTDQTPASKDTPAISDASMAAWMEYLHMQKPKPTNATGVTVQLTAIADGNTYQIGDVTSDSSGNFGVTWEPPAEGQYQITATFVGTDSYASSESTTYLAVGPAPASPSPTATPTAPTSPTATPTASPSPSQPEGPGGGENTAIYVGIAAVVIVAVVAAAALVLRRRK